MAQKLYKIGINRCKIGHFSKLARIPKNLSPDMKNSANFTLENVETCFSGAILLTKRASYLCSVAIIGGFTEVR